MDNSARVIAITITPGFIMPCFRINRAIDVSSRVHGGSFYVEVKFWWVHNGVPAGPVTFSQTEASTTFIAQLDAMWIRGQGARVAVPSQPDHGSVVTASAIMYVKDAAGVRIDQCFAEVTTFTAR